MVDFAQAITLGFDAVDEADQNRTEIKQVFELLNKQLAKVITEKLEIRIRECTERKKKALSAAERLAMDAGILVGAGYEYDDHKYLALVVNRKEDTQSGIELAKWGQSAKGYPCKLQYADKHVSCDDKEGLENALADMLKNPVVARKIRDLMKG